MKRRKNGFTLIELMIVLTFLVVIVFGIGYLSIAAANFWCTDAGVEKQLKAQYPEVTSVIAINRGVWGSTVVLTKTKNEVTREYCVDSNVLFNYDIEPCSK